MLIRRQWAMPNKNTFQIKCINDLIFKYFNANQNSVDPFANTNNICKYKNDIDPEFNCEYNMDAIEFLRTFDNESIDFLLFDPPYSSRQLAECYKKINKAVTITDTQSSYWSDIKYEIARIIKPGGVCISFGWNSTGIGLQNDFNIIEVLIVCHGSMHNDTICVVEKKFKSILFDL